MFILVDLANMQVLAQSLQLVTHMILYLGEAFCTIDK